MLVTAVLCLKPKMKLFFHFSICFLYVYRFFSLFLFHSRLYDAFVGQVYLGAMSTLLFSSFYRVFYSDSLLYCICSAMYLGEEACAFVGAFKEHLQMSTH